MKKYSYSFIAMLCLAILEAVTISCGTKLTGQQAATAGQQAAPASQQTTAAAQQQAAARRMQQRMQVLFDSLTPAQQNSFFTNVKHIMDPEVKVIQPGAVNSDPPSDAIILFDGKNLNEWEEVARGTSGAGGVIPATWIIKDGGMQPTTSSGTVRTKRVFNDFQLHIEWKTPVGLAETVTGQNRGNSGIIIEGLYEVQVLDSYNNRTYNNGQAGAIYMQYPPLVNVSRKPGEWQAYEIIYTAPRFKDSTTYFTPPRITIFHNGVLVQNNVSIQGPTVSPGIPQYIIEEHGPGPIQLQQHGNPTTFRNIWIREL